MSEEFAHKHASPSSLFSSRIFIVYTTSMRPQAIWPCVLYVCLASFGVAPRDRLVPPASHRPGAGPGEDARAIAFTTARGNTFDGFALDIESDAVADPGRRTQRLVRLSAEIREEAGEDYPLGAVFPSPIRLRDDLAYWPGFPWRDLALTYDAIMPMTYYTFRAHGPAASFDYVADSIDEIRARVGTDQVPVHVIGGLARDAAIPETLAFARAVDDGRSSAGVGTRGRTPTLSNGAPCAASGERPGSIDPPAAAPIGSGRSRPVSDRRSPHPMRLRSRFARGLAASILRSPSPHARRRSIRTAWKTH